MRQVGKCQEGNAYVFVLVIMFCTFSMLAISLHTVNYGVKVSAANADQLNVYGMAESGATSAEKVLNALLNENYDEIFRRASLDVLNAVSENTVLYMPSTAGDPYGGSFRLKLPNAGGFRGATDELFKKHFLENAADIIPSAAIGNSSYTISLTERENGDKSHYTVMVSPAVTGGLNSRAVLAGTDITATVEAVIALGYGDGARREVLHPKFKWLTPPDWTAYGAYAAGEIKVGDGDISGTFMELAPDIIPYEPVELPGFLWSPENPLAVVSGAALDVSSFYLDDEPVYTAVISEGGAVSLYTTDNTKNQFNGIVFSNGSIYLHGINTRGSLVSLGEIMIDSPEGETVISHEPEALFKINISNEVTRYRLYDYLGITDFKSGSGELRTVLNNLTLDKGGALEIFEPVRGAGFKIKMLREVRS